MLLPKTGYLGASVYIVLFCLLVLVSDARGGGRRKPFQGESVFAARTKGSAYNISNFAASHNHHDRDSEFSAKGKSKNLL